MTPLIAYLGSLILACLVLYALLGGADFGGGVWDLFATGPRADDQRRLIAKTMAPIWEANHIWLIAVIVLLFACFPEAYATIGTDLHLPLTAMLVGIVLRGTAFVFRTYDAQRDDVFHVWSRVFAAASVVTPVMLGVCLGAVARFPFSGPPTTFRERYVDPWLAPFPIAVGLFVLAVFAFLAAVYLTNETDDVELQEAFRERALGASIAVTVLAWTVQATALRGNAVFLLLGLRSSRWALPFHGFTATLGAVIFYTLWTRRYRWARAAAIAQVTAVILGFGASQWPFLIMGRVMLQHAAAPEPVLRAVAIAMTGGLLVLGPAYVWLFRVFRTGAGGRRA